jgi:hypothetical protein
MPNSVREQYWWPTPSLTVEHDDLVEFNAALAALILIEERRLRSTVTGEPVAGLTHGMTTLWRKYNVLNWDYPECRTLKDMAMDGVRRFFAMVGNPEDPDFKVLGVSAWANVLRVGESLQIHHHDQAFVNAHYFVQTGQTGTDKEVILESGHTVYYRPGFIERSHGERHSEVINPWDADWRVSLAPKPGNFLFFPGYVRHEVRPHLGHAERISIAFDFYIQRQSPLIYFGGPQWFVP